MPRPEGLLETPHVMVKLAQFLATGGVGWLLSATLLSTYVINIVR